MSILVIDSHKGSEGEIPTNLHWQNAKQVADYLGADLIWSYPSVNEALKMNGVYDKIIFVHASPYCAVDKAWIDNSPDADLYYVTNEYNLGEPTILWKPAKAGRHYTVIANHEPDISKVVKKYTKSWRKVNLNALCYKPSRVHKVQTDIDMFPDRRQGIVYYGSFRRGRIPSFQKYLRGNVIVSTHPKNVIKFRSATGCYRANFIPRIDWNNRGLIDFEASLYIEDEVTHNSYNYLANRFYEALNDNCPTLFDYSCWNTIQRSGYTVPNSLIVNSYHDLARATLSIPYAWHYQAAAEKDEALKQIKEIVCG
jgi:hypothetical protein